LGAAYYIVLEKKIDGFDSSMDGKALARSSEALEEIATSLGVRPLTSFTSIDPGDAAAFLQAEGMDSIEIKLPPLQQFSAEEGLVTVRALLAHLQSQPSLVRKSDDVLLDLRACERILNAASTQAVRWHFEVDF